MGWIKPSSLDCPFSKECGWPIISYKCKIHIVPSYKWYIARLRWKLAGLWPGSIWR